MKTKFILIALLSISFAVSAQKATNYSSIDNKMKLIPDSATKSSKQIAYFINSCFSTENDKIRAIYYWVAKNIRYDVKNMYSINFYENKNQIIDKIFSTRKGVCIDYATLFCDIANKTGIKSYVIDGYTKLDGSVDYIPHSWVVAQIDSKWFQFDPTWGAGYVANSKFVSLLNNNYFMTKPEELIKSHMPFDPLWQLLNYTVTNAEFYQSKTGINTKKPFFNFNDSISNYEELPEIEQLSASTKRLETNGVSNSILFDRFQYNKRQIEYLKSKQFSEIYNKALTDYNEGINGLNEFINYRNKQFGPTKSDPQIKLMLYTVDNSFVSAKKSIEQINTSDPNFQTLVNQLKQSIDVADKNLSEQKSFLSKYMSTGKLFRKSLFYKYSWMGIPIN